MKYLLITSLFVLSMQLYGYSPIPQKTIIEVNTSILQKQINYTPIIKANEIDATKSIKNQKRNYTITRVIIAVAGLGLIVTAAAIPGINVVLAGVIDGIGIALLTTAIFAGDYVQAEWEQNRQERKRERQLRKVAKVSKASNR